MDYARNLGAWWSDHYEDDSRYHGLHNQGATCYLNSVLQVLFMTRDFREAVKRNSCRDHIDVQLNSLFADLKTQTAETVKITRKLGIHRVNEQRDAAEHFEKILMMASEDAARVFRGRLEHMTLCCGCGSEDQEEAAFWNLPLPLVASSSRSYSVEDGIREFFGTSTFENDDQLYCDRCCAKRDATARCVVKEHPDVLMLLLKRFEFNYHQMAFVKNNREVEIPPSIMIPENQVYELYAFVEHFGSLKGGHYTATIRPQRDAGWHSFNDSSVTLLRKQPFRSNGTERSQSAYLLFYRRRHSGESYEFCQDAGTERSETGKRRDGEEAGSGQKKRRKTESWTDEERNEGSKVESGVRDEERGGKEKLHQGEAAGGRGPEVRGPEVQYQGLKVQDQGPEIRGQDTKIRGPEVRGPEFQGPKVRGQGLDVQDQDPVVRDPEVRGQDPKVRGPEVGVRGPEIGGQGPEVRDQGPKVRGPKVGGQSPKVRGPEVGGQGSEVQYQGPKVQGPKVQGPKVRGQGLDVQDQDPVGWDPEVGGQGPKVRGQEVRGPEVRGQSPKVQDPKVRDSKVRDQGLKVRDPEVGGQGSNVPDQCQEVRGQRAAGGRQEAGGETSPRKRGPPADAEPREGGGRQAGPEGGGAEGGDPRPRRWSREGPKGGGRRPRRSRR